jgi:hypothetical protein
MPDQFQVRRGGRRSGKEQPRPKTSNVARLEAQVVDAQKNDVITVRKLLGANEGAREQITPPTDKGCLNTAKLTWALWD